MHSLSKKISFDKKLINIQNHPKLHKKNEQMTSLLTCLISIGPKLSLMWVIYSAFLTSLTADRVCVCVCVCVNLRVLVCLGIIT